LSEAPAHERPLPRVRRILAIANRVPYPLDDGWKVRTFHVLRALSEIAPVSLAAFATEPAEHVQALTAAMGGRLTASLAPAPASATPVALALGALTRDPVHVWNQESHALREIVRREGARSDIDLVLSVTTFMSRYAALARAGALQVCDTHNIDSILLSRYAETETRTLRRWYALRTARNLAGLEQRTYAKMDEVWFCSQKEADIATAQLPALRACHIPNGVDTTHMQPQGDAPVVPLRALFFGKLDYYPNEDAMLYLAESIWPRIRSMAPGATLDVVGASPPPRVRALCESMPDWTCVGRVSDVRPYLARAACVLVPLRAGGGTRLKILEAMAMGRPVVTTTIGAEGLSLRPGEEAMFADHADAFADAVVRVFTAPELARSLGTAARAAAVERFGWSNIAGRIHDRIAALPPRRT